MKKQGCATLKTMPYTDFRTQPNASARSEASQFKAESYVRLDGKNLTAIKAVLADGNPVVIGMKTYENFMNYKSGVYQATSGQYLGGHAMVIVGYDDGKKAFKILNSWSEQWGEKGFCWYDYDLFTQNNHTSMVMYDAAMNTPEKSVPPNEVIASSGAYTDPDPGFLARSEERRILHRLQVRKDSRPHSRKRRRPRAPCTSTPRRRRRSNTSTR